MHPNVIKEMTMMVMYITSKLAHNGMKDGSILAFLTLTLNFTNEYYITLFQKDLTVI